MSINHIISIGVLAGLTAVYYVLLANVYSLNHDMIHFSPAFYALSFWSLPFLSTIIFYKLEKRDHGQQKAGKLNAVRFVLMYAVLLTVIVVTRDQYKLSFNILEQEVMGLHIVMFLIGLLFSWVLGNFLIKRIFTPHINEQQSI